MRSRRGLAIALLDKKVAPVLTLEESELLVQINQGVPSDLRRRYRALAEKRNAETLTEIECQELLASSDRIKILAAQRVEALAKLAQLRQVSLLQGMDDLGIESPSYA